MHLVSDSALQHELPRIVHVSSHLCVRCDAALGSLTVHKDHTLRLLGETLC